MRIGGLFRKAASESRGTAAIEFGIIAPVLVVVLFGLVELSFAVQQAMQVQDAAEAGAVYAGKHGWNAAGIVSAVVNATGAAGVTADPPPVQFCGCPSAGGIAAVACTDTCAGGGSPSHYARISASMPHTPILTGMGLPIPDVFTGHAVVRVE